MGCRSTLWLSMLAILTVTPAWANTVDQLRLPLLNGQFDQAVQAASPSSGNVREDGDTAAFTAYYQGLAAFAQRDYAKAVAAMVGVTEKHGDKPVALKAAVVATLALSRKGDHKNACQNAGVVMPLTPSLSPIWRAWVEEARRTSACQ